MAVGRCPCGYTALAVQVAGHQAGCAEFARAYTADPESVLAPEAEYERWKQGDRATEKAGAHAVSVADTDARRAAMASRFVTRDFLEDD